MVLRYYPERLDDAKMESAFEKLLETYPIAAGRWAGPDNDRPQLVVNPGLESGPRIGGVPFSVCETPCSFEEWKALLEAGQVQPGIVDGIWAGDNYMPDMAEWMGAGAGNPDGPLLTLRITHELDGPGS